MSNEKLSNKEISLLTKGLKFVPTPQTLKKQANNVTILQEEYASDMHLQIKRKNNTSFT